jgi:excinuclease UvrABC nuclease subunit
MNSPSEELFDSSVALDQDNNTPDALADIPTCKGVLLFTDSSDTPIQLLQAANLRRTARVKLFRQDEGISKRTDISKLASKIYWRCCYNVS